MLEFKAEDLVNVCPACEGSGKDLKRSDWLNSYPCPSCDGDGKWLTKTGEVIMDAMEGVKRREIKYRR